MATTILDRIKAVQAPPLVNLFRLPSHRLITIGQPINDRTHVITVYAGDSDNMLPPVQVMLAKVGYGRDSSPYPWFTDDQKLFVETNCRTCPHMLAAVQGGDFDCPAAYGRLEEAFTNDDDYDGFICCALGEEAPDATASRLHPTTAYLSRLPFSYQMTLTPADPNVGVRAEYGISSLYVQHLLESNGIFYAGGTAEAINTHPGGNVCWGSNNGKPGTAEVTDRIYSSIFNLDLTRDYPGLVREYSRSYGSYQSAKAIASRGEHQDMGDVHFKPIDSSTVLSVDNEVNGLMCVKPAKYGHAYDMLAASGAATTPMGILLPVRQHTLRAGDSYVSGYITPILPAINRCWFLQADLTNNDNFGKLLGQIDPPDDL